MKTLRITIVLALTACTLLGQHEEVKNLHASPEDVVAGGRIFFSHCAVCHGLLGVGDRAPALTSGQFRYGGSDGALHQTISRGVPGTEMPGIYFDGVEVWQLVAYVKSLSTSREANAPTGDAVAGRKIYSVRGCSGCHRVSGEGGRSGPDLSNIGGSRSLGHLRTAILSPNEKVLPQHWTVRVVTKDGTEIAGRRLNEDTFTIQLLGSEDRLLSLPKSELASYEIVRESAMPSYQGMIRDDDLEDLMSYLVSLRRRRAAQ